MNSIDSLVLSKINKKPKSKIYKQIKKYSLITFLTGVSILYAGCSYDLKKGKLMGKNLYVEAPSEYEINQFRFMEPVDEPFPMKINLIEVKF